MGSFEPFLLVYGVELAGMPALHRFSPPVGIPSEELLLHPRAIRPSHQAVAPAISFSTRRHITAWVAKVLYGVAAPAPLKSCKMR